MSNAPSSGTFANRLAAAVRRRCTPVMVGLDPRLESLPEALVGSAQPPTLEAKAALYQRFCEGVIDVVASLVPIVKPQAAFFEQLGAPGMSALAEVIRYARKAGLLVVLDGKRNDIGTTAEAYAEAFLGPGEASAWGSDALTVSPYLGADSLDPFVERAVLQDAGIFVLVKTSNPGSGLLQDLQIEGQPLYRRVAALVEQLAERTSDKGPYGAVGAVVGATYPEQLAELRQAMPHAWLLVPGYGAQGGAAKDVAVAFDDEGLGAVVNNSRGIIFAYGRGPHRDRFAPADWQRAVEQATRDMIEELAAHSTASRLRGASASSVKA